MKYVEAFNSLGYKVPRPRLDWSAEKADGICITLWKVQVDWSPPPPRFDLWKHGTPGMMDWEKLPGHGLQRQHIRRAMGEFGGKVDVVVVHGTPGQGFGDAEPWDASKRRGHTWRVTRIDEASGYYAAAAEAGGRA
jgi:hypothetical protein